METETLSSRPQWSPDHPPPPPLFVHIRRGAPSTCAPYKRRHSSSVSARRHSRSSTTLRTTHGPQFPFLCVNSSGLHPFFVFTERRGVPPARYLDKRFRDNGNAPAIFPRSATADCLFSLAGTQAANLSERPTPPPPPPSPPPSYLDQS